MYFTPRFCQLNCIKYLECQTFISSMQRNESKVLYSARDSIFLRFDVNAQHYQSINIYNTVFHFKNHVKTVELVIQEHIQIKFYFVNLTFKYKVYMYFKKFNRDLNLIDYFSFELSLLIFTLENCHFMKINLMVQVQSNLILFIDLHYKSQYRYTVHDSHVRDTDIYLQFSFTTFQTCF